MTNAFSIYEIELYIMHVGNVFILQQNRSLEAKVIHS